MAFQFAQFLPMLAQMAGSMQSQQYSGGGGGAPGGGGGAAGGMGMAKMAADTNPVLGALKGVLGAGLKTPPPPIGTDGSAGASVNYGGGAQPAPAYQPPPQQDQPGLRNIFGGPSQQLGYGGGGARGPLEGLGGQGPMPTEASNFARVFPGAAMNMGGGMGMAQGAVASPGGGQGGGLLALLSMLRGMGGGMR